MDNASPEQSSSVRRAWLFIVLLGPPLGAFVVFAPWYLSAVIREGKSITDILRGLPPAMAFASIFSYVAGLPAAIAFATLGGYWMRKHQSLSWRATLLFAVIAALVAFLWTYLLLTNNGARQIMQGSLIAGFTAIASSILCRVLIEALQLMPLSPGLKLPDGAKPVAYAFLGIWFGIMVIGLERL